MNQNNNENQMTNTHKIIIMVLAAISGFIYISDVFSSGVRLFGATILLIVFITTVEHIKRKGQGKMPENIQTIITWILLIGIILSIIVGCSSTDSHISSNSVGRKTNTCQFCDREFDRTSEDGRSISRTNMCRNCVNNYKSFEKYLGE